MTDISPPPTPADQSRMLAEILGEIRSGKRRQMVDVIIAVVISLAALASAWCAYQSSRWNGTQLGLVGDADFFVVETTRHTIEANQYRTVDAMMLMNYLEARGRNDDVTARLIRSRFRPEVRESIEKWLATNPWDNPDSHARVFAPEMGYRLEGEEKARELSAQAAKARAASSQAGSNGDRYTLLALLFASVMFVGGIASTFDSRNVRVMLCAVAIALFLGAAAATLVSPVCPM